MPRFALIDEIAFEGGHFRFVEKWTFRAAPEVEEVIDGILAFSGFGVVLESRANEHARIMEQVFSAISAPGIDFHFAQGAVFVEWNGGVEEQVAVIYGVHASVSEDIPYVLAQFLADHERMVELLHEDFFLIGQEVRIGRVDGREVVADQLVVFPVEVDGSLFVINQVEKVSALHVPLWVSVEDLRFQLELDDGDGLVHERRQAFGLVVYALGSAAQAGLEFLARVVAIGFHRECGQWDKVDSVAVFKRCEVGVAQGKANDIADAGVVSSTCAHPQDVMVAPRDVPIVVVGERVHDDVCAGTAVVDIAKNMQLVNSQPLYDGGDGDDEVVGTSR